MTQRDLAAAVGVTESSIAQYESGRMSPRWGKADALDHTLGANGAILAAYGHTRAHAGHTKPAPKTANDPTPTPRAEGGGVGSSCGQEEGRDL